MSANEIVTNVVINASTNGVTKSTNQLDTLAATCQRIPQFIRMQVAAGKTAGQISAIDKAILGLGNQTAAVNGKVADMRNMFATIAENADNKDLAKAFRGPQADITDMANGVNLAAGAWEHYRETLSNLGITRLSKEAQAAAKLMLGSVAPVGGANASYVNKVAANTGGTEQVGLITSQASSATKSLDAQAAKEAKDAAKAARDAAAAAKEQARAAKENERAQRDAARETERQASAARKAAKEEAQLALAQIRLKRASDALAKSTDKATKALNKQNGITAITAGGFFRLRAVISAVVLALATLGGAITKWFKLASEYAETNHLLYATLYNDYKDLAGSEQTVLTATDLFGNKIQSTTTMSVEAADAIEGIVDKLNSMSRALMVDPTNLKRTYATFYEMANSANMARENVDELATGMTRLTYDIGSLWDEDFESVAKKMRSALGGITTAVRLFGIDISRTAADTWLAAHGIDATYNSLSRANKMIVIYNMLLEGTSTAQNDLAASAAQPANMLRILSEQAQYAARSLGAALFPLLTPLIALFIKLAQAIQVAANTLASFLSSIFGGWYNSASKGWNSFLSNLGQTKGASSGLEEIADDMEDVSSGAGGAADAAKELKKQLLGFDEINNITPETPTSGGGGGGGIGGGTADLDIPMLTMGDMFAEVEAMISQFLEESVPNLLRFAANAVWGFVQGFISGFGLIPTLLMTIASALDHVIGGLRLMFGTYEENGETRYYFDDMVTGVGKFIGALAGLSIGIGLFDKLGSLIVGLFSSTGLLTKAFTPLISIFKALKMAVPTGLLTRALALAGGSNVLTASLKGLLSALLTIASPVKLIIAAVAALSAAFLYCYNNSEEFRNFLASVGEQISKVGELIVSMVQPAFEALQTAFANLASALGMTSGPLDILSVALEVLISIVTGVVEAVVLAASALVTGVTYVVEFIVNLVAGLIEIVTGAVTSFFEFLGSIFGTGEETVTTDSETMKASVIGAFEGMSLESIPIIGGFLATVGGFFSSAGATLGNAMAVIGSAVSGGWAYVSGLVSSAFNALSSTFSLVFDIMTTPFTQAWEKISEVFDWLTNLLSGELSFPHISVPHFHIDGGVLPWGIGGMGRKPDISVEWYAKGGIATGASLIGVGEAGDEGIIPLQGARMKPFAMAISDNINRYGVGKTTQTDRDILEATIVQSNLIREQNQLLREILNKDTSVNLDGKAIINSINRQQRIQGRQLIGV